MTIAYLLLVAVAEMISLVCLGFIKMKTRAILTILLFMFIWANQVAHSCVCATDNSLQLGNQQTILNSTISDLCGDCGHTRTCCVNHQNLSMATASLTQTVQVQTIEPLNYCLKQDFYSKNCADYKTKLRAPPKHLLVQTPQSLKQILLI